MTQDNLLEGNIETITITLDNLQRIIEAEKFNERRRIHELASEIYNDELVGLQYGKKNRDIHLKGRKHALLELIARAGLAR